jgi:nicotinamide mononucleotide (NMN) deamidase PncC
MNTDEVPEKIAAQLVAGEPEAYTEVMAARAAAELRANTGAAYALALLGTQGEQEGVYGTTSGRTWIGIATPAGSQAVLCPYGGQDEYTITLIGNNALRLLWQELKQTC